MFLKTAFTITTITLPAAAFFFDLTVYDKEAPIDDPNQPLGTDRETFKKILRRRYNRANGEIGQLLGFPPWWMKYTKDSGTAVS